MEIAQIKQQLTIQTVLAHYGLKADKNQKLCCPFHEDKTPSMQVYPKTNTVYCFSANCPTHGKAIDVIDFMMHKESLNKHHAIKKATALMSNSQSRFIGNKLVMRNEKEAASPTLNITHSTLTRVAVLSKVAAETKASLGKTDKAVVYMKERGLDSNSLEMGYIGESLGRGWNKNLQESAEALHVLRKTNTGGYLPAMRYCLVFYLKNKENQIVSLYGRSILSPSEAPSPLGKAGDGAKHFYLKDRQGLYPGYPKPETKILILTEAILDAATLQMYYPLAAGFSILSLYGTNGFTEEHTGAVSQLKDLTEIIFFLDGDEAGRKATTHIAHQIIEMGKQLTLSFVDTPENEDINSLAVNHPGEETTLFTHLIASRQPFRILSATQAGTTKQNDVPAPPSGGQAIRGLNTTNPELPIYTHEPLQITILGGIKLTGLDRLKVTLKIAVIKTALPDQLADTGTFRHNLDLYHYQQTQQLSTKIAETFHIPTTAVNAILNDLTAALEQYRENRLEAMKPKKQAPYQMSAAAQKEALALLQDPNLLNKTSSLIQESGMTGEATNALIAYLVYTSRKRENPLHVMSLGASGTGKTYLQEKVSELIPEEDKIEITTLSENAFYYFGKEELKHKLILIEDLDGAETVLYPLRELQSKKKISKTVTLKDSKGNLKTVTLTVEGPVSVSSCTTRERLYEDNANRCLLLYIDGSAAQDERIIRYQQAQSAGKTDKQQEQQAKALLKNVQRLLRPVAVINPYAEYITLPQEVFKPRRTMQLLLSFIETITYYHQYQRGSQTSRLDATSAEEGLTASIQTSIADIETAFNLLKDILFRKSDELSGGCRNFYERLQSHVGDKTFYSKDIRSAFRMNPHNLKHYLKELSSYNYIKTTGGNPYRGFEYQINTENKAANLRNSIEEQLNQIITKIKKVANSS